MDLKKLNELAYKHLGDRKAHYEREKGFIYYHGQRVAKIAISLREILLPHNDSKDQVMIVGSYFHDIAKGIEPHGQYGAVLAKEILKDYCEPAELEDITEIIRYHQLRKKENNYPDYIKIVQDADILDHVGIIEVWMNFQYYSYMDAPIIESVDYYKNEFPNHAKKIKDMLNYDVSQRIYDEKISFVQSFSDRMSIEALGGIYNIEEVK